MSEIKIEHNEDLFLEIHITVNPHCDVNYDFKVYDVNPSKNYGRTDLNKEEDLWMDGFIKWDGCVNFIFINGQSNEMEHSCELFGSFIEKLKWIEKILKSYID